MPDSMRQGLLHGITPLQHFQFDDGIMKAKRLMERVENFEKEKRRRR